MSISATLGARRNPLPLHRSAWTLRQRYRRLSFERQFVLASLAVLVATGLALGAWVGREVETGVLNRTATVTALYVESVVSPHLQTLKSRSSLDADEMSTLDGLIAQTRFGDRVVNIKVWTPDGTIVYSPDRLQVGRQFPMNAGLIGALQGGVPAHLS